jgi:hypothetical protein
VFGPESGDVVDERLRARPVATGRLDPDSVETGDPGLVEDGVHGDDALEFSRERVEVLGSEDARGARGLEGVGGDRVPAAEDDVVEGGEIDEFTDGSWMTVARVDTTELAQ